MNKKSLIVFLIGAQGSLSAVYAATGDEKEPYDILTGNEIVNSPTTTASALAEGDFSANDDVYSAPEDSGLDDFSILADSDKKSAFDGYSMFVEGAGKSMIEEFNKNANEELLTTVSNKEKELEQLEKEI